MTMDAVEFLKARKRLCNFAEYCENCPLHVNSSVCSFTTSNESDECAVVSIVEQWAKELPAKTRQSEFLKVFPNAFMNGQVLGICPSLVDGHTCRMEERSCAECRHDYWLKELE